MNSIDRRAVLGGLALAAAVPCSARAQSAGGWHPTRPIQLVVGFAPGGGSDDIARTIAEAAAPSIPEPMVVVNRPGAGGALAAEQVARAPCQTATLCCWPAAARAPPCPLTATCPTTRSGHSAR
jgi:tripartite-type tricarboxylate transporter receptor subunit TctC